MKLHYSGLFGGIGPMPVMCQNHVQDVQIIRNITSVILGKAGKLVQSEDQLTSGAIDPSWEFAMYYASLLLISHGDNVLQDMNWAQKVDNLTYALDKVSKRWKIAERHCESVKIKLDNRSTGRAR
jgi:uncharacterized membrane protein